ncbi:MAG: hypothetical protein JJ964_06815 [Rhizobiales bacterium]|nr:hypothetical protein [Hyphomicrobiales bacterium]
MARIIAPDLYGGFSTRAGSVNEKKSFEQNPPNPPPQPDPVVKKMEWKVLEQQGVKLDERGNYPQKLHRRTVEEATRKREAIPEHMRAKEGTNIEKYSHDLPRYTDPRKAAQTLQTAENYDPVQTLFRYDPATLNLEAEKGFRAIPKNKDKKFIPPHDTSVPVYEGMLKREGGVKAVRAWTQDKTRERGGYFADIRDYQKKTGKPSSEVLKEFEVKAVQATYALPVEPDRTTEVTSKPWNPDKGKGVFQVDRQETDHETGERLEKAKNIRMVKISKTVGGGEQIIGNPKNFKFPKNDPEP